MFSSIRAKIILFYLTVLFVTLSVLGIFLYISLSKIVHHSIDSSLMSGAKAIATLIQRDNNATEFNFSDEVIWEYNSPRSKRFFQIRQRDGTSLEKSASLGRRELPFEKLDKGIHFKTIVLNGEPVRVVNFFMPEGDNRPNTGEKALTEEKNHGLIIQCAEDIDDRLDYLERFSLVLAVSILFILLISASGGFLIARKALKPVKEISKTIDRISESNLSERIGAENIPTELKALALSFNRTFNRLEHSFGRQRQFAADASHELRTPLSVIMSQCEITLRRARSSGEYQGALKTVAQAAALMTDMVQKLLNLTRLGADKKILKIEPQCLDEIVRESVELLTPLAEQKGISINNDFRESIALPGDRALLVELFSNLIENAIKYNRPHGRITISFHKDSSQMVCRIEDTGIGIPETDLERIFDRFYRVDKSRSKEIGGSGLGLSIGKEIAELHDGQIKITSRLGVGTTTSVYFRILP